MTVYMYKDVEVYEAIRRLEQQRDDLLAALEKVHKEANRGNSNPKLTLVTVKLMLEQAIARIQHSEGG